MPELENSPVKGEFMETQTNSKVTDLVRIIKQDTDLPLRLQALEELFQLVGKQSKFQIFLKKVVDNDPEEKMRQKARVLLEQMEAALKDGTENSSIEQVQNSGLDKLMSSQESLLKGLSKSLNEINERVANYSKNTEILSVQGLRSLLIIIIVLLVANLLVGLSQLGTSALSAFKANENEKLIPEEKINYTYQYEYISTRSQCGLTDDEYYLVSLTNSIEGSPQEVYAESQKIATRTFNCITESISTHLSNKSNEGWRLVSINNLQPSQIDLGFEFDYRLVWEKP